MNTVGHQTLTKRTEIGLQRNANIAFLPAECAAVSAVGGMDLAERLLQDQKMSQSKEACAGLSDMKLLFSYLQLFKVTDKVRHAVCHASHNSFFKQY